jgi:hypothetical protein
MVVVFFQELSEKLFVIFPSKRVRIGVFDVDCLLA